MNLAEATAGRHIADFEGTIKLHLTDAGELLFGLYDGDTSTELTHSEDFAGEQVVEGVWDGEDTMSLRIDGETVESTTFRGPIDASGLDRMWVLFGQYQARRSFWDGGEVRDLRLVRRGTTELEGKAIASQFW